MPKLRVSVGPDRFHQIIARVNDIGKPTEIDTPLFAGRVLVYVKDFCGVTPDGTPPVTDCSYFDGRSRKFGILIEGRFKAREGIEPYTGDEVQFGSDFDFLPPSFPRGPFKVGMKIARMVDPATSFEENPPNGRPYIMSPYLGAMNTICAYPSPAALPRAVLIAHHDAAHPHEAGEARLGGFVPIEELEGSKRVQKNPWRFLGLRGDPKVESFITSHSHLLESPLETSPQTTIPTISIPHGQALGTTTPTSSEHSSDEESGSQMSTEIYAEPKHSKPSTPVGANTPAKTKPASSRFSLAAMRHALQGADVLGAGDLVLGNQLAFEASTSEHGGLDAQFGPWRFGKEGVDAMEDSTFAFVDPEHPRSVAQRRKHFVVDSGKNRKDFVYDPEIVYTTSFFTNWYDLNSLQLKMGPVNLDISDFFDAMPIRYALRSTRLAPKPDVTPGPMEEETFCTIAFDLVDD